MTTGLAVFDTTVQETNEWLQMIEDRLPPCDRQDAYAALRAVLHVLRDRLQQSAVLGVSAQVPMLMRGLLLEGWRPGVGPTKIRDPDEFAQEVAERLPPRFPREPVAVLEAVLDVLSARLDVGEVKKLLEYLPDALHVFWPEWVRKYLDRPGRSAG